MLLIAAIIIFIYFRRDDTLLRRHAACRDAAIMLMLFAQDATCYGIRAGCLRDVALIRHFARFEELPFIISLRFLSLLCRYALSLIISMPCCHATICCHTTPHAYTMMP